MYVIVIFYGKAGSFDGGRATAIDHIQLDTRLAAERAYDALQNGKPDGATIVKCF